MKKGNFLKKTTFVTRFAEPQSPGAVAPTNLNILEQKNSDCRVGWTAPAEYDSFDFQYADNPEFTGVNSFNVTETSIDITQDTEPEDVVYARVRTVLGEELSSWVNIVFQVDALLYLDDPALSATATNTDQIDLSWTVPPQSTSGVLYSVDSEGVILSTLVSDATGQTSYDVTGLTAETQYFYRVEFETTNVDYYDSITSTANDTTQATPTLLPISNIVIRNNATNPDTEWDISWTNPPNYTAVVVLIDSNPVYSGVDSSFTATGLSNFNTYELNFTAAGIGYDPSTVIVNKEKLPDSPSTALQSGDGQFFWGELSITPLPLEEKSQITYTGSGGDPFVSGDVGKRFGVYRNTLSPSTFPNGSVNYAPEVISTINSTVTDYIDGTNIKVDWVYNGGDSDTPQSTTLQSGWIGTDMSVYFRTQTENGSREEILELQDDTIYIWEIIPEINPSNAGKSVKYTRSFTGTNPPVIYLATDDGFSIGEDGTGDAPSFNAQYYESKASGQRKYFNFKTLDDLGVIFEDVNICPPFFAQPSNQASFPDLVFFYDTASNEAAYVSGTGTTGRKNRIIRSDTYYLRDQMTAALGVSLGVFDDASYVFPKIGWCTYGGKEGDRGDGVNDVTEFAEYELEDTSVTCWEVQELKSEECAGVLWKLTSSDGSHFAKENVGVKLAIETDVPIRFRKHPTEPDKFTLVDTNDPAFSWYFWMNQYWFGGNRNNGMSVYPTDPENVMLRNVADQRSILGSNTDYSVPAAYTAFIQSSKEALMYGKFPEVGEVIGRANTYYYPIGLIESISGNVITVNPSRFMRYYTKQIKVANRTGFQVGEEIVGSISGATATIGDLPSGNSFIRFLYTYPDDNNPVLFQYNETVTGQTSGASSTIKKDESEDLTAYDIEDWDWDIWPSAPLDPSNSFVDDRISSSFSEGSNARITAYDDVNYTVTINSFPAKGFKVGEFLVGWRAKSTASYDDLNYGVIDKDDVSYDKKTHQYTRTPNDRIWFFWGYSIYVGDQFMTSEGLRTVVAIDYIDFPGGGWPFTYQEYWDYRCGKYVQVTFDLPYTADVRDASFTVVTSTTEHYYTDGYTNSKVAAAYNDVEFDNDKNPIYLNHLWYSSGGVNFQFDGYELGNTQGLYTLANAVGGFWRTTTKLKAWDQGVDHSGAARIGSFKDVKTGNYGGIGNEWMPAGIKNRQDNDGSAPSGYDPVFEIDGGEVGLMQPIEEPQRPVITYKNSPAVMYNRQSKANQYNVTNVDFDASFSGWSLGNDQPAAITIYPYNSMVFDATNMSGMQIFINGNESDSTDFELIIDGYSPSIQPNGNYWGVTGKGSFDFTVTITGDAGQGCLDLQRPGMDSSDDIIINLTNWTLVPQYRRESEVMLNFTRTTDPAGSTSLGTPTSIVGDTITYSGGGLIGQITNGADIRRDSDNLLIGTIDSHTDTTITLTGAAASATLSDLRQQDYTQFDANIVIKDSGDNDIRPSNIMA